MQQCQCETREMTNLAMPADASRLCHHSTPTEIEQAKDRYTQLLSRLANGLDPYIMTQATLAQASIHYAQVRLTPQQRNMLNQYELNIVQSAFLRTRATMTTLLLLEKLLQTSLMTERQPPDTAQTDTQQEERQPQ